MRKKWIIGTILLIVGVIILLPYVYFLYQKYNYPVEMYQQPIRIEYDFTKPGITLEEVQELNGNQAVIEYQENSRTVYSIEGMISSQKICDLEDALAVVYDYRDVFGVKEYEYEGFLLQKDNLNFYIFNQLHNGIEVNGYGFNIITTEEGECIKIIGDYLNVSAMLTDSFLSYKECWKINKAFFKGIRKEKVKLLICKFRGSIELCWQYDVSDKHGRNRQTVYVSALDGEIVWISADAVS